jgi:hypothetical protein
MKMRSLGLLAGLVLLVSASHASAATVYITYTGTVSNGYDRGGLFGPEGANLSGDSYVANYVFDTSLGVTYSSPIQNYAFGGSSYSDASPALSASVTINGRTVAFTPNYVGEIYAYDNGSFREQAHIAASTGWQWSLANYIHNFNGTLPVTIDRAFIYHLVSGDTENGGYFGGGSTGLYLSPLSLTETGGISPTPLPAALPLFAGGLGVIGLVARLRNRKDAVSA